MDSLTIILAILVIALLVEGWVLLSLIRHVNHMKSALNDTFGRIGTDMAMLQMQLIEQSHHDE